MGDKNTTWIMLAVAAPLVTGFMLCLCLIKHRNHKRRFAHFSESESDKQDWKDVHHTYPSDDSSSSEEEISFDEGLGSGCSDDDGSVSEGEPPPTPKVPPAVTNSASGSSSSASDEETGSASDEE